MNTRIIKSAEDLLSLPTDMSKTGFPLTVSWAKGEKRSRPQNQTIHMWFKQIADHQGHEAGFVKGVCKLTYGLPIMQAENSAWVERWAPLYEPLLDNPSLYEQKALLFEALPMTRQFTSPQMAAFMASVQMAAIKRGVRLTDPEERKYAGAFR